MAIYERLKAWERCHQLCVAVYNATNSWPTAERYGLVSQARRAAHSAAANIAEGSAKKGSREFRRYLDISLGSLSELSYTLLLAKDLKIPVIPVLPVLPALPVARSARPCFDDELPSSSPDQPSQAPPR